ncbi:hypothetical protein AAIE21_18005 [Paenibacillus sp. 102]
MPQSTVPSKDVEKVPWAAENLPVPESNQAGATSLSVAQIIKVTDENKKA